VIPSQPEGLTASPELNRAALSWFATRGWGSPGGSPGFSRRREANPSAGVEFPPEPNSLGSARIDLDSMSLATTSTGLGELSSLRQFPAGRSDLALRREWRRPILDV